MYIHYRTIHNKGIMWFDVSDAKFPCNIPLASECTWIIPGTIDPND